MDEDQHQIDENRPEIATVVIIVVVLDIVVVVGLVWCQFGAVSGIKMIKVQNQLWIWSVGGCGGGCCGVCVVFVVGGDKGQ